MSQCEAINEGWGYGGGSKNYGKQCSRKAVMSVEGKDYCKQHGEKEAEGVSWRHARDRQRDMVKAQDAVDEALQRLGGAAERWFESGQPEELEDIVAAWKLAKERHAVTVEAFDHAKIHHETQYGHAHWGIQGLWPTVVHPAVPQDEADHQHSPA